MDLNDARDLKRSLTEQLVKRVSQRMTARTLDLPAGPLAGAKEAPPSLALGVARAGRNDFKLAVRIQQHSRMVDEYLDAIRKKAAGETDERFIGPLRKLAATWHRKRHRPLRIGTSIGHYRITAGTLGCFVTSRRGGHPLILSNNHVLADENRGKRGDAILQPGRYDNGVRPKDVVGKLEKFVKFKRTGPNLLDCAVCTVKDGILYDAAKLEGLGRLTGLSDALLDEGDAVAKIGRTTGLTRGRVTAFELDNVRVEFDLGVLRFDNQIEIEGDGDEPFSAGGDSGSLVVNADLRGVGLLFAGGECGGSNERGLTYANPLRAVLDTLKVDLLGVG